MGECYNETNGLWLLENSSHEENLHKFDKLATSVIQASCINVHEARAIIEDKLWKECPRDSVWMTNFQLAFLLDFVNLIDNIPFAITSYLDGIRLQALNTFNKGVEKCALSRPGVTYTYD